MLCKKRRRIRKAHLRKCLRKWSQLKARRVLLAEKDSAKKAAARKKLIDEDDEEMDEAGEDMASDHGMTEDEDVAFDFNE